MNLLILETGHANFLRPIAEGLRRRGYTIVWDKIKSSRQLDSADIVWLSALSFGGTQGELIISFSRAAKASKAKLVSYYIGDWTNLAESRKVLKGVDWSGFSLCFHANPALVAELRQLCPSARELPFVYLPVVMHPAYVYHDRKEFKRRIGMWGQYAHWWKDAWWLIRAFGKLQDMTSEHWQLEFRGCRPEHLEELPPIAKYEAEKLGVKFFPWGSFETLVQWVHSLDIVANGSLSEGDALPIGEGMLTGCYPLVRNWPGACDLYPEEYIVENDYDFVQKAMGWGEKSDATKRQLSSEAAAFARKKHDLAVATETVDSEFQRLLKR